MSNPASAATGPGSGMKSGAGSGLRDLLSTVAQQVESHLRPSSLLTLPRSSSSSPSLGSRHERVGRRSSRIRSWIAHDRAADQSRSDDGGDNSLHFTDSDDDDFEIVVAGATGGNSARASRQDTQQRGDKERRNDTNQAQHPHLPQRRAHATRPQHDNSNEDARRMQLSPDELREEETVDMLTGLMGEGFDREVARRILRKYDGNVDKAAGALLEGERGEELIGAPGPGQIQTQGWPAMHPGNASGGTAGWVGPQARGDTSSGLGGRPGTPVIDLTLDDDPDLQRAMQESMSTQYAPAYPPSQLQSQSYGEMYAPDRGRSRVPRPMETETQAEQPVFGPSERASDPNWAIVPSNTETSDANYLQSLSRAIEASLETAGDSDALEPFPVEQQLRRDGCPVVLRPSLHTMVYAASILQGLFYVPQVRERMASWRPPIPSNEEEAAAPMSGPDFTLWALSEIFTHMDLARLCDLNVDKRLPAFNIESWERLAQTPGELSRKFFARLSATLEKAFVEQFMHTGQPLPKPRLLHFQYGSGISEPGELLQETSIVPIDVNGGQSNDLIGRLSAQLSKLQSEPGKQSVIFEPSQVVAFELARSSPSNATSGSGAERKPFTYPNSIYLDQFLRDNVEVAQAKRAQRREMLEEVQRLVSHKNTLTHFDGKDTLKDLRSSIYYFENVADSKGDAEREASICATTLKLKSILTTIEAEVKDTNEKIERLRTQAETLLECEELQQYKYDLRVVFVHDGLYGRKHLYSYVHDKSCWWKIADSLIEKVPEEVVLNDQTGLHLGAGPYLLFYSRATDGPASVLPWMDDIKDDVKAANREFLSQLPPELVGDIVIDEEDMSYPSAALSRTPALRSSQVRDRMDIS